MGHRHHSSKILLFVAALFAAHPITAADCVQRIAAEGPSDRTVALMGGDAWPLLSDYFKEVKRRKLDVAPKSVQIVLQTQGKQETLDLPWAKLLTGASPEKLWENSLRGKRAEASDELLARADNSKWDVMCPAPTQKPKPTPTPVPTPVPKPDPRPNTDIIHASSASASEVLLYFKSGVQYASQRDYANALKEFKVAEKLNQNFPGLLMNIGVTYMQLKDYVRASDYLTRAVAQSPGDPSTRLNMACLQARLAQYDDAIASLTAAKANGMQMTPAIRKDPDLAALRGRKEFEALFQPARSK